MEGALRTPNTQPQSSKQMSSRLMNMKFMQRATASTPPNQRGGPQTPSTEPASKRRKTHDAGTSPSRSVSSTPGGTPYAAENRPMQQSSNALHDILRRGGTSTFFRGEGADTEWVLDLKLPAAAAPNKPHLKNIRSNNHRTIGGNESAIPGLGEVDDENDAETSQYKEEEEEEEEDIWYDQLAGRQTYGSFKRKNKTGDKRKSTNGEAGDDDDDDEDLSSASHSSASDSDSDRASDSNSDSMPFSADDDNSKSNRGQYGTPQKNKSKKQQQPGRDKKHAAAAAAGAENSDEEMRRVRRAMEQKHDRMAGLGGGGRKQQRGQDGLSHDRGRRGYGDSARRSKKARKTI